MQWTIRTTVLSLLASTTAALPTAVGSDVRAVPNALELGRRAVNTSVDTEVWLINTSDEPIELTGAKGKCGCVSVRDFAPSAIAASGAARVRLSVEAPKVAGENKDTSIVFSMEGGRVLSVPVRMQSVDAAEASEPLEQVSDARADLPTALVAVAERSSFTVPPEALATGTVWLVNTGDQPLTVEAVKGDCGCLSAPGFGPVTLSVGQAHSVAFELRGAKVETDRRAKRLRFLTREHGPVEVALHLTTRPSTPGLAGATRDIPSLAGPAR